MLLASAVLAVLCSWTAVAVAGVAAVTAVCHRVGQTPTVTHAVH